MNEGECGADWENSSSNLGLKIDEIHIVEPPNTHESENQENFGDVSNSPVGQTSNNVTHLDNSKETNNGTTVQNDSLNDMKNASEPEADIADNTDLSLPSTAIMLETDWGSKVYLVGTAHFSEQSQEDVARVIRAVQPNFVVLELCESRSYMLKWEEDEILKIAEKMEFKMVRETIRTYGVMQGVMYLLLLSVSAQITRELGMAPGGEFRRAYKEAALVPNCVIHLGDRPIEITLRRAFASLSWWQSIKFAFYVIFNKKKINEDDIEKCKNRDYLEEMLAMLGGEFPELKNVFVNERDLFLSYSLVNAAVSTTSPRGIVPNKVVGVVGVGHLPGVQRNWGKFDPAEFRKVLQIPPPSRSSKVLKFTLKASVLILAIYGVHKLASKFGRYASMFEEPDQKLIALVIIKMSEELIAKLSIQKTYDH